MRRKFNILNKYLGVEYIISFLISFLFFFFIFFINQILVLAQKIMLKNVRIGDVIVLVVLSIPQFLMYTMPFSSLASASMVIGNFSSQNEILAMRASGIDFRHIFRPIVLLSMILSVATLGIADYLIPYTAVAYRELYAKVLQDMPTLELESFSSTQFGNRIISNGLVKDNIIHDVLIFDDSDKANSRVITATEASINVVDLDKFIYRIDLKNPEILITDEHSLETYSTASSEELTLFIDLSSNSSGYTSITPSQMGIRQLMDAVKTKEIEQEGLNKDYNKTIGQYNNRLANILFEIEESGKADDESFSKIVQYVNRIKNTENNKSYSFYYQYYRSELNKKFALSLACTFLVFLAFPISFFKIRYGKLVGFGISMLLACFYWFFLYYMHTMAIQTYRNPAIFMWLPDAVVFIGGLLLINRLKRN